MMHQPGHNVRVVAIAAMLMLSTFAAAPTFLRAQALGGNRPSPATTSSLAQSPPREALMRQQAVFIENKGQWDMRARFLLRSPGMDLWITDNGVVYDLRHVEPIDNNTSLPMSRVLGSTNDESTALQQPELKVTSTPVFITYEGASRKASAAGTGELPHYHNYYIGNDRSKWASHVPLYTDASVRGLYDGIDAVFYLDNGRPRYDLVVAPGADPAKIRMKIEGATNVTIAPNGALRIATSLGVVEQRELFAYQEIHGERRKVECGFAVNNDGSVAFATGRYDRSRPLVIDPLVWSTFLGGTSNENVGNWQGGSGGTDGVCGIAVDPHGNVYVTGSTYSTNFPTLNPMQSSNNSSVQTAFVTKFTTTGGRSYSTYLGGNDNGYYDRGDEGLGIAVDSNGNAYITGYTRSRSFPTLNALQSSNGNSNGSADAFITKLTSSGALSYSTYFGGFYNDKGCAITVDGSGNAYVAGWTGSFSIPGASESGPYSGFMTKVTSSGALSFSRYVLGYAHGIAVDGSGNILVAGATANDNSGVARDVFATKLTSSGVVSYNVTFGGSVNDIGNGIGVDASGNAYIVGHTASSNFPTANAFQSTFGGNTDDVFVTKLTTTGSIAYSTFLGTSGQEFGNAIAVDASGTAYVTGQWGPTAPSYVSANAFQSSNAGATDVFVARLASSGSLTHFTFIGGGGHDFGGGIAVDGSGYVYLTGWTQAPFGGNTTYFPTQNAAQSSLAGGQDAFVAKLLINAVTSVALANSGPYCSGSSVTVSWQSSGVSSVNIDLSTNDGSTWSSIATSQSSGTSGGSYSWTVPNSPGSGRKVRVSDASNSSINSVSSSFTILAAPSFTDSPDDVSTTAFSTGGATFSATATGSTPLSFQWQVSTDGGSSWGNLSGEASDTYSIDAQDLVTSLSGNEYRVSVTNACSTVASQPATLTVAKATASVALGHLEHAYDATVKSATATTTPAGLSVTISYAQSSLPVTAPTAAGDYDVSASINDDNYQGSTTGTLTITKAPLAVAAADNEKTCGETNPTLTGSIDGVQGNDAIGVTCTTSATSASGAGDYAIVPVASGSALANYDVTYTNGTLTIHPPAFATHPMDQVVASGATATFTASAAGSETLQWQVSTDGGTTWDDIDGATSTTLSFTATASLSGNQYRVVIDNGTCTANSLAATLSVKIVATDFGPAVMFLGVVNNQDNNRHIDLRIELYRNTLLVSSGELIDDKVTGPNQNGSRKYTVPLTMTNGAVDFGADDQLSVKVFARRNGGNGDFPVLLWYNDSPLPNINHGNKGWARVGTETVGGTNTGYFYLLDDQELSTSSGSSGRSIQRTLGTSWVLYDTWTMYGSSMKPTAAGATAGGLIVQVLPNPVSAGNAHLSISSPTAGNASVTVFDQLGRQVSHQEDIRLESGDRATLSLDLGPIPNGVYSVVVSNGSQSASTSLVIMR